MLVGIPGLIMAAVMFFLVREPAHHAVGGTAIARTSFVDLFRHRNVPLAMLTLMCAMGGVFVMGAMMPNYLTDYLHLSLQDMGFVASAIGFGGCIGQFAMPTISDFIGRKMATLLSYILAALFTYLFTRAGADNLSILFVLLFFAALFNFRRWRSWRGRSRRKRRPSAWSRPWPVWSSAPARYSAAAWRRSSPARSRDRAVSSTSLPSRSPA